jgi:hypothetical protein
MFIILLIGQMISSRPPLSPEEAIAVLRASHVVVDHTEMISAPPEVYDWGLNDVGVYVLNSHTGEGPYGPFPAYVNHSGGSIYYVRPFYPGRYSRGNYTRSFYQPFRFTPVRISPLVSTPPRNIYMTGAAGGAARR